MIDKQFLQLINPKSKPYNPKYSQGTYAFLHKNINKDIKIYWLNKNYVTGNITTFNRKAIKFYPTQIYFMYKINGDWLGTSWTKIMRNEYQVVDFSSWEMNEFEDITEWFCDEYVKIGRCLFDRGHTNFLLGENHNYVSNEERFEIVDGVKYCKWCGKEIK